MKSDTIEMIYNKLKRLGIESYIYKPDRYHRIIMWSEKDSLKETYFKGTLRQIKQLVWILETFMESSNKTG